MTTQTLNTPNNPAAVSPLLKRVLALDALSCLGMGLLGTLLNTQVADFLGIRSAFVFNLMTGANFVAFLGISLLIFGAFVGWNAASEAVDERMIWAIIVANAAWVVASFLLLVTNALPLSTAGGWLVMLQADAVLLIAIAEIVGLRRLNQS